tara:strand:- start:4599 stop:4721 length:123 start_codon:yes stop_codon:yes gene_type:complete
LLFGLIIQGKEPEKESEKLLVEKLEAFLYTDDKFCNPKIN